MQMKKWQNITSYITYIQKHQEIRWRLLRFFPLDRNFAIIISFTPMGLWMWQWAAASKARTRGAKFTAQSFAPFLAWECFFSFTRFSSTTREQKLSPFHTPQQSCNGHSGRAHYLVRFMKIGLLNCDGRTDGGMLKLRTNENPLQCKCLQRWRSALKNK